LELTREWKKLSEGRLHSKTALREAWTVKEKWRKSIGHTVTRECEIGKKMGVSADNFVSTETNHGTS